MNSEYFWIHSEKFFEQARHLGASGIGLMMEVICDCSNNQIDVFDPKNFEEIAEICQHRISREGIKDPKNAQVIHELRTGGYKRYLAPAEQGGV